MSESMSKSSPARPQYSRKSHLIGVLILLAISTSFVASSFITQQLRMPFFCSYFNNSFSLVYIVAFLGQTLLRRDHQRNSTNGDRSPRQVRIETAKQALLFMPLLYTMSVTFNWSLEKTSMSNNSVICSSSGFFALMFSWVLMRSPIRFINMLGAMLSMVGIFLVSWFTDSDSTSSLYGDASAMISAILSGFYTSLMSRRIPDGSPVNMTLFFGLVGLFGFIAFLPVIFLVHHFGIEPRLVYMHADEITKLFGNAFLTIIANLMWAKAIQLTSPFIATIGLGMTTPLTMVVDYLVLNKRFGYEYCIGVALVILGYLITNIQHRNDGEDRLQAQIVNGNDDVKKFELAIVA